MSDSEPRKTKPLLEFGSIQAADIERCFEIEAASYPEDEAATLESLSYRQAKAPHAYRGAWLSSSDDEHTPIRTLIGFVCSTQCITFEHDSMTTHYPNGRILAIHSVVIEERFRRNGYATTMLLDYVKQLRKDGAELGIQTIMLLAKAHLLPFYISCGFRVNGISPIEHGQDTWYDLELEIFSAKANLIQYWVVDAFTDTFGCGNPAAVVDMPNPRGLGASGKSQTEKTVEWRQTVAKEFNLSETAFMWKRKDSNNSSNEDSSVHYDIRYYTNTGVEIALCGHATLASAAVLFQSDPKLCTLTFHTMDDSVILSVDKRSTNVNTNAKSPIIKSSMLFPWKEVVRFPEGSDPELNGLDLMKDSLNVDPEDIRFIGVGDGGEDLFVELSTDAFHKIPSTDEISFTPMIQSTLYTRGIAICCKSDIPRTDFLSRFFGPKVGIMEDPVTGSAHCLLAPYCGGGMGGKPSLVGQQMSSRRGIVECELLDLHPSGKRVEISGSAVIFMNGTLLV
jgi:PhzF family phenazine biosynthesis protein